MKRKARLTKVRFGIVGLGVIGRIHAAGIVASRSREFRLGSVADTAADVAERAGRELNVPSFTDPQAMFDSGLIDAVIVATPHYLHPPLTIRAARSGLHVLCEKPLAVTVGPARAMIAECRKRNVVLAAMLQMRTRGIMRRMKQMVEAGRIGRIHRVSMICTNWYRTQAYYDSGSWRGTWDGEGGGILLNQAPHSLDLFQWIGGMPGSVVATAATRLHRIEVENTATIVCDYGQGKTGFFYASTAEAPGTEQLLVCGDKGTLVLEGGTLRLGKLARPISRHIFEYKEHMADNILQPRCRWSEVPYPPGGGQRMDVIRAFSRHLLAGTPMVAGGEESINELEISNAAYLSAFKGKRVDLPVNAAEMDRLIAKLASERSKGKGGNHRALAERELRRLLKRNRSAT